MSKPTKEKIDKYRQIVACVPAFKKEPTHFIEDHEIYTNTGTAVSIENLREIVALWDENQKLVKQFKEILKKEGDILYSQTDYSYVLQDCIATAKGALGND